MVNILLESYQLDKPYLVGALRQYLRAGMRAAVIPFAFRDNRVRCAADMDRLYGRGSGKYYADTVAGFASYGIAEEDISFVNYFTDTRESAA